MLVKYQEAIDQAKVFLRGQGKRLLGVDWTRITEQSRMRFSKDKPRELVFDITGNGTSLYTLTAIATGWVNKFSQVTTLEYPANQQTPVFLQQEKWSIYRPDNTNEKLKLYQDAPTASQTMRLNYTVPHTLTNATSTIEDNDLELFAILAAHYAAQAMVSDLLQENRSNLNADSTDFSQKQNDMQALADKLLAKYTDAVKGKTGTVPSFKTALQDYDIFPSYGGGFIIHDEDSR